MDYPTYDRTQRLAVVQYERAEIGDAYKFLGAGPDEWDCSGLTMMAWREVGVELPHQAADQIRRIRGGISGITGENYDRIGHVVAYSVKAQSRLQLGDLVFVYGSVNDPDSVSHVATFSGWQTINGVKRRMIIAAVNEQYGVIETTIDWAPGVSGFGYIGHGEEAAA